MGVRNADQLSEDSREQKQAGRRRAAQWLQCFLCALRGVVIRQSLSRALANQARTIRLPVHIELLLGRFSKKKAGLIQLLGRAPITEAIAKALDHPLESPSAGELLLQVNDWASLRRSADPSWCSMGSVALGSRSCVLLGQGPSRESRIRAVSSPMRRLAGAPGMLRHDFRRTAVRNLVKVGVPERVAMTITGHKTRCVFDRYHIVSPGDLREAARKLPGTISGTTAVSVIDATPQLRENQGTGG